MQQFESYINIININVHSLFLVVYKKQTYQPLNALKEVIDSVSSFTSDYHRKLCPLLPELIVLHALSCMTSISGHESCRRTEGQDATTVEAFPSESVS